MPLGDAVTVSWLKVPQDSQPKISEDALLVDAVLDNQIALRSVDFVSQADGLIQVVLIWESLVERPDIDATIFVHALAGDGTIVTQSDIRPWDGQYPTFIWGGGERVQTEHLLAVNGRTDLTLSIGMYTFPDLVRLPVIYNNVEAENRSISLGNLDDLLTD